MKRILPPGVGRGRFEAAVAAWRRELGEAWVFDTDEDRASYIDPYAKGDGSAHAPSAIIAPADMAQLQAALRIANEARLPLWPVSRGKNLGYGGAQPVLAGSVILDLGRMKRIIEVNVELGYCIVEPGVTFFELHEYLQREHTGLEAAIPGNGWGSVLGNALERGFSWRGDHSSSVCGLEVLLGTGELVRTGMGAMSGSDSWASFRHGFGPSWDQMFIHSNLGVVTKMGLWLHPTPEHQIQIGVALDKPEDLGWYIDAVRPLRLRNVVDGHVAVTTIMNIVAAQTQRSEWYQGRDSLPDPVYAQLRDRYGLGWWNGTLRLSGYREANEAHLKVVLDALARHTRQEFPVTRFHSHERPVPGPSLNPLSTVNWYGGRGGHLSFSPVVPAVGRKIVEQFQRTRRRYQEFGIDYASTWYNGGRAVANINLIFADMDDADMVDRADRLFRALVKDAREMGYGEYRTHIDYMDAVADTFDFNNHALRRLNEQVKDSLDPNGILAPGRNGVWPKAWRHLRGKP
ncbi:MAG: hypothetical protein RL026_735 [Pseudomonadota bacterium]